MDLLWRIICLLATTPVLFAYQLSEQEQLYLDKYQYQQHSYFARHQKHQSGRLQQQQQQQQQASFEKPSFNFGNQPYYQSASLVGRVQRNVNPSIKDFVTLKSVIKEIHDNLTVKITFQCSRPLVISLMIDGYEDKDAWFRNSSNPLLVNDPTIIFKKSFMCGYSESVRRKSVTVKIPKRFACSPNILMLKSSRMNDMKLKVFMTDLLEWKYLKMRKNLFRHKMHILFERSKKKLQLPVSDTSPYDRKKCNFNKCLSWPSQMLDELVVKKSLKSVREDECSSLISFPIVMSEEPYGVIKTYYPFYNNELKRPHKPSMIRITLSVQMYLSSWCKSHEMCSLFQHVDPKDHFETPLVLINSKGQLHVQAKLSNEKPSAHTTSWSVPIQEWVRLDFQLFNTVMNVTMFHGRNFSETKNLPVVFSNRISFVDSSGYFVVGGTIFCRNLNGVIGSAYFCRNQEVGSEKIPLPHKQEDMFEYDLTQYERKQKVLRISIKKKMKFYSKMQQKNICVPYFIKLVRAGMESHEQLQCLADSAPLPTRFDELSKILQRLPAAVDSGDVVKQAGEELYNVFLEKLEPVNSLRNLSSEILLLKQAAKLGHDLSHFLLYVIHKNGIGTKPNLKMARFHLLTGGKQGERLCLKTLGYNHLIGNAGFPSDLPLSFFYYFNAARKTYKDYLEHSESLTAVNNARLTDEKNMKQQLSEEDDLFHWIKHQATKGVFSAQRNMARLLYWGQQGLQRNLNAAFKMYEEAAQAGDASALYDYGIVLVKGHGTEVNTQKGIEVLKQAAELKNPGAFNTLGWYYSTQEVNMTKAKEYFEIADEMGSIDAAYNLGVMYHTGTYPGSGKDYKMAFKKYYRAASGGHVDASIQVSHLTATGIDKFLYPNTLNAIHWSRYISEKNPTMGVVIREGLQAYRRQSWSKSILMYLAAAETGFEVAQFNAAFLCEENKNNLVRDSVESECAWKYWNITSNFPAAHPYALNKMGDFYYYGNGGKVDVKKALTYYGLAAKKNFPQAIFNIACMLEAHEDITNNSLKGLNIPPSALQSRQETIVHLYRKCSDMSGDSTSMPCYMALMRTQLVQMWHQTSMIAKVSTFLVVVMTTLIIIVQIMRSRNERRNRNSPSHSRIDGPHHGNGEAGSDVESGEETAEGGVEMKENRDERLSAESEEQRA